MAEGVEFGGELLKSLSGGIKSLPRLRRPVGMPFRRVIRPSILNHPGALAAHTHKQTMTLAEAPTNTAQRHLPRPVQGVWARRFRKQDPRPKEKSVDSARAWRMACSRTSDCCSLPRPLYIEGRAKQEAHQRKGRPFLLILAGNVRNEGIQASVYKVN